MKKGKKPKKRKRGVASRKRVEKQPIPIQPKPIPGDVKFPQDSKEKQQRLKELENENHDIFEKIISQYELSPDDVLWLEYEFKLGLRVIIDFEDATLDDYEELYTHTYDSEPLKQIVYETDISEAFWRASFDLSNELGLSMIKIDEDGNISGDRVEY